MTDELPAVLRVEEVAVLLRISRSSAYEAIRQGQIPAIRVGRRLRVSRAALEQLLGAEAGQKSALNGGVTRADASDSGV
jgi:excisionase family DNA binding protein